MMIKVLNVVFLQPYVTKHDTETMEDKKDMYERIIAKVEVALTEIEKVKDAEGQSKAKQVGGRSRWSICVPILEISKTC